MPETIHKTIERKILLNPGPATTTAAVKAALVIEDICPREQEFGLLMSDVREKVKKVVFADENYETILLGGSGTGAIEACLSSSVDAQDKVIIIENGAYGKRMGQICEALGIAHQVLKFDWGQVIDWDQVDSFLSENKQEARTLAFVHHETTTGILNDLEKFKQMADKHQLVSIVDAMSSYAGIEINLSKVGVDYLISSSNKCIQGMAGIGIVIAKASELLKIKEFKRKSYYFDLYQNFVSQKEKKQFAFTPPVQILYALNVALDEFFKSGGIEARANRYAELYESMLKGMRELGFICMLETEHNSKILTTFYEPKCSGYSFEQMHDYFYSRGITIYPGKVDAKATFRISNIGELNQSDITLYLETMQGFLKSAGIQL